MLYVYPESSRLAFGERCRELGQSTTQIASDHTYTVTSFRPFVTAGSTAMPVGTRSVLAYKAESVAMTANAAYGMTS